MKQGTAALNSFSTHGCESKANWG